MIVTDTQLQANESGEDSEDQAQEILFEYSMKLINPRKMSMQMETLHASI